VKKKAEEQIYGSVTGEYVECSALSRRFKAACGDTKGKTTRV
jgi:hypothetical protein